MTDQSVAILQQLLEQSRKNDYPDLKPDKFFEIFAAQQILKRQRFNLDPPEIESGIVGGDGDGGVDGFYLFVNRKYVREDTPSDLFKDQQLTLELNIIQAKNKTSFEESVPSKFKDFVENCLGLGTTLTAEQSMLYSDALKSLVGQFHEIYTPSLILRPKLTINFFHVTLGEQVDPKVESRATLLVQRVKDFFPTAECHYEFIRGSELYRLFQQQPQRELSVKTPKYFDWKSFDRNAYACVVGLRDFYDFITDTGTLREYMFEANVRDYARDVKVNRAIRATLTNPQNDDFWWLNNGVTVLSSGVLYADGALKMTDPLIVNGLQTSYEIYEHFSNGGGVKDERRTVLLKVIANTDTDSSDRIINATNSQTKIDIVSLHATEQIQRDIEVALKSVDLYYDRRKNYYRNRGIAASKIVTIGYLAQGIAAIVLQQPDNARARPTTVAEKNYSALFSKKYPITLYPQCAQILKRVDGFMDRQDLPAGLKLNLVFYVAMYATCAALKSVRPKRSTIAKMNLALLTDDVLKESYRHVEDAYSVLGATDKIAKGTLLVDALKKEILGRYGKKPKQAKVE